MKIPKVMIMATSDSGGGAGIQADIKAVAACGGHATTVFAALTAQNTVGVQGIFPIPLDFIQLQFESIMQDIGLDALKTGMLYDLPRVELAARLISQVRVPVVVDPVMVAKGGDKLMTDDAIIGIKELLFPLATLITPNLDEAEVLLRRRVRDQEAMEKAAADLALLGPRAVLLKGGHLEKEPLDVLFDGREYYYFKAPRLNTPHTHGTGCTLASACACLLGKGLALPEAVQEARAVVRHGIINGLALGAGHGPLHVLAGSNAGQSITAKA